MIEPRYQQQEDEVPESGIEHYVVETHEDSEGSQDFPYPAIERVLAVLRTRLNKDVTVKPSPQVVTTLSETVSALKAEKRINGNTSQEGYFQNRNKSIDDETDKHIISDDRYTSKGMFDGLASRARQLYIQQSNTTTRTSTRQRRTRVEYSKDDHVPVKMHSLTELILQTLNNNRMQFYFCIWKKWLALRLKLRNRIRRFWYYNRFRRIFNDRFIDSCLQRFGKIHLSILVERMMTKRRVFTQWIAFTT